MTIEETYNRESAETKYIVELLVACESDFRAYTISQIYAHAANKYRFKKSKSFQQIQPYLVEAGKDWNGTYYFVRPEIYAEALLSMASQGVFSEYRASMADLLSSLRAYYDRPAPIPYVLNQLFCFVSGDPVPQPIETDEEGSYHLLVIGHILCDERFANFYPYIDLSILLRIINYNIVAQYFFFEWEYSKPTIIERTKQVAQRFHSPIVQSIENIEWFLKGRFSEIEGRLGDALTDQYVNIGLRLLNKQFESAFEILTKVLSRTKKELKEDFPIDPFMQIIAVLSVSIAHKEKINTTTIPKLLKKGVVKNSPFLFISLSLVSGVDHDEISRSIANSKKTVSSPITDLFLYIIAKKYNYSVIERVNSANLEHIRTTLQRYGLDWLLWELSSVVHTSQEEQNRLKEKIKVDPIALQFEGIREWELVLDSLMAIPDQERKESQTGKRVSYLWYAGLPANRNNNEIDHDRVRIVPIQQSVSVNGNWSKGKNISLSRFANKDAEGMTQQDLEIATTCIVSYSYGSPFFNISRALTKLVGHPHLILDSNRDIRIELLEEPPQITIRKKKNSVEVSANVDISDELVVLKRENDARFKLINLTLQQRQIVNKLLKIKNFPPESEGKIKELLGHLSSTITVFSDIDQNSQNSRLVEGNSIIVVQLLPIGQAIKAELFVKPIPGSPPYLKPGVGVAQLYVMHEGEKINIKRNLKQETANITLVSEALNKVQNNTDQADTYLFEEAEECLELFDALNDIQDHIVIEWPEGAKFKFLGRVVSTNLNIQVSEKNNWFEMEGEVRIDEQYALTLLELLKAVRSSDSRFIELKPGEFVALSKSLHRQLRELDNVVKDDRKKLKLPLFASSVINDLEDASINLSVDKRVEKLRKKIKDSQNQTFETPRNLQAELRPYQEEGYQWMARLAEWGAGACLADDMGLGKTIQTIAILLFKARSGASLVVVPASVQPNWEREINRFAPSLNVININTATNRSQTLLDAQANDICLITYGVMQTESELIAQKEFAVAVLDEAHTIKNSETKASKAAMKINAAFRIALTGTPVQNHLGEIWNLFQFTNPALLGSREQFNERFVRPIVEQKNRDQQNRLRKLIAPFLLRRIKSAVLDELPSKTEIQHDIELSNEETIVYESIRREAEKLLNENPEMNKIEALALITKLRMAACHIGLVNPEMGFNSAKTKALVQLSQELIANNHRALVFSQFTSHLALIKKALDQAQIGYLYLDGSTPIKERERLVQEFQNGETPLFLISLKAGGLGLNLTAADYVFHIDPWWNPAIENQASDRSHRIGQKRPVTIYRLVAQNTIEEKILRLHAAKKEMADSLLEGTDAAQRLSNDDILELLKS